MYVAQLVKMFGSLVQNGVIDSYLNSLQVYADSSGMQVKVKSGGAWVKGEYYENDAEEN